MKNMKKQHGNKEAQKNNTNAAKINADVSIVIRCSSEQREEYKKLAKDYGFKDFAKFFRAIIDEKIKARRVVCKSLRCTGTLERDK